jgi:hypothetical protein
MIVVGLGHRSRTGKDTVAKHLKKIIRNRQKRCTVNICGFADELKKFCHKEFGLETNEFYEANPSERQKPLKPHGKTPVEVWCEVGDFFRKFKEDYWIQKLFEANVSTDVLIIKDVRYLNEFTAIKSFGGYAYKIRRSSAPIINSVADGSLENSDSIWDAIYDNENEDDPYKIAENIYGRMTWLT